MDAAWVRHHTWLPSSFVSKSWHAGLEVHARYGDAKWSVKGSLATQQKLQCLGHLQAPLEHP